MTEDIYTAIPPDRPGTIEELHELYAPMARYWAHELYVEHRDAQRSLDDLEQDAWVGIMEAWHRWDSGQGATFKTWANSMARWAVLNGNRNVDRGLFRAYIYDRELYAKILGMVSLDALSKAGSKDTSDRGMSLKDLIPDPIAEEEFDLRLAWDSFLSIVRLAQRRRARSAIVGYFWSGLTMEDVGTLMEPPVTKERVRQLIVEGLADIKRRAIWP